MERKIRDHLTLLGCKSSSEIAMAYQVYLELSNVKLMHDIELHFNDNIGKVYLKAKATKNSSPHIFVPQSTSDSLNMSYIERLQTNLCKCEIQKSVTLACLEGDSTMVFYTFTNHLIDQQNPEISVKQKTREDRKRHLENDIQKNRNAILFKAFENKSCEK